MDLLNLGEIKALKRTAELMGTQRFVSGNICSESLKSPAIFVFTAVKARDFFDETSRRTFVTRGRDKYVV